MRTLTRAGSNGIDIKVSRHHTITVSNFYSINGATGDWMVHLSLYSGLHTAANSSIEFSIIIAT